MKMRSCVFLIVLLLSAVALMADARADSYSTFRKTRFYSASRRYFVEVTESKRATLYRNGKRARRVWARTLDALPGPVLVKDDGSRVVVIDRYYGNERDPAVKVITLLDESGKELSSYRLREVADLSRVVATISASHWYGGAEFAPGERFLVVKTLVGKYPECRQGKEPPTAPGGCIESVPHEQFRFDTATGNLIERTGVAAR